MSPPVLFRREPIAPVDHTSAGIGIRRRKPLRHRRLDILWQLRRGPFLASFDAGLYDYEVHRDAR